MGPPQSDSVHYRGGRSFTTLLGQARELRRKQTPAEEILWQLLRGRKLSGAKFRRQHQFGPWVCDFYCHEARLVVEVDGAVHREREQVVKDRDRDANMQAEGLTVLRFWNNEVDDDIERVLTEISAHLIRT